MLLSRVCCLRPGTGAPSYNIRVSQAAATHPPRPWGHLQGDHLRPRPVTREPKVRQLRAEVGQRLGQRRVLFIHLKVATKEVGP